MATCSATLLLLLLLMNLKALISASPITNTPKNAQDLVVATEEMARANYFTFVMLVNMCPDKIPGNVTFLMPNDRMLSKIRISQNLVSGFLLHHSIPSPMLFDLLQLIPSGSTIPSSDPDFMLNVNNNGRKNFFLNNVKIISPNICTAGSSIRCHGIDGVIADANELGSSPTCSPSVAPLPVPAPATGASPAPAADGSSAPAQPPDQSVVPKKSGSWCLRHSGLLKLLLMASAVVSIILV